MATPNSALDHAGAKRIIERYLAAHDRAFLERGTSDYEIPFQVMRDYLDVMAAARKGPGLHNVTITITRGPMLGLIHPDILIEDDITVRVEGQKWDR